MYILMEKFAFFHLESFSNDYRVGNFINNEIL